MANGKPSAGCCCFINNVRFLILMLTISAISSLFANLILFDLTSILHTDLESQEKPVSGLTSLHEYSVWHDRRKREIPTSIDKVKTKNEDDGYPILPPTKKTTAKAKDTTKLVTTKSRKPETMFITNYPETTTTVGIRTTRMSNVQSDVVLSEVEKTLEKLRKAENGEPVEDLNTNVKFDDYGNEVNTIGNKLQRCILYASAGFGVLVGLYPAVSLSQKLQFRKAVFIYLAMSALLNIIFPFVATRNFLLLLILRISQGFAFSIVFPLMGHVLVNWGSLNEQLFFLASMLMFTCLGPAFSWPISMLFYTNDMPIYGIYFSHAFFLIFIAILWIIFYRDSPQNHPWVTGIELNKIIAGKVQALHSNRTPSKSFPSLFKSLSAWSIWLCFFTFFLAISLFSIYLPSFLSSQDVFFVDYLGVYSSLPFILLFIFTFISLLIIGFMSHTTMTVRIFNAIGFCISAVFIVALPLVAYIGTENIPLYILSITIAPISISIVGGFGRSLTVVGRVFAKELLTTSGIVFGLAFVIMPVVVSFVVMENKIADWMRVMFFVVFIMLIASVEFAVFGRGRSASWAESSWDPLVASTKMQSLALIDFNQDECGLYELRRVEPNK